MFSSVKKVSSFLSQTRDVVRPFGLKPIMWMLFLMLLQAVLQGVGVTSVFPFLSLLTHPEGGMDWVPDAVSHWSHFHKILAAGVLTVTLMSLTSALSFFIHWKTVAFSHSFDHWLRMDLVKRVLARDYGYFLRRNSTLLAKKIVDDSENFVWEILLPLLELVTVLLSAIVLFSVVWVISPIVAVASFVVLGGYYGFCMWFFKKKRVSASHLIGESREGLTVSTHHLLGGIKPVLFSGRTDHFVEQVDRPSREKAKQTIAVSLYSRAPRHILMPLSLAGAIAVILMYVGQGESFQELVPNLGVITLAAWRLVPAAQSIYSNLTGLSSSKYCLDEIWEEYEEGTVIEEELEENLPALSLEKDIQLHGVSFSYDSAAAATLNRVDLKILKGEKVALVGETGSGKTTLIDILIGLHRPAEGAVSLDGERLTYRQMSSLRRCISYVPQDVFLLDDTIKHNVAFGYRENAIDREKLEKVLRMAQLENFLGGLEQGVNSEVGERGVRLSGGQRQRIGIARALYEDPDLLILDEATGALDAETEAAFFAALEENYPEMTLVCVTHRPSLAAQCDRVYRLSEKGELGEV